MAFSGLEGPTAEKLYGKDPNRRVDKCGCRWVYIGPTAFSGPRWIRQHACLIHSTEAPKLEDNEHEALADAQRGHNQRRF